MWFIADTQYEVYSDANAPGRQDDSVSGNQFCEYKADLCRIISCQRLGWLHVYWHLFPDESVMKDLKPLGCKEHSDAEVCC